MEYLWLVIPACMTLLVVLLIKERNQKKETLTQLEKDGFKHVFYGDGMNFIAFNLVNGYFRFGRLNSGDFAERPVNFITNYEWKWVDRNAQRLSNKFFFYISDVGHSMHEVFYNDKARKAEVEWAKIQAVYSECCSSQYQVVENMERNDRYDFFVSHASEDKNEFVRPLVQELNSLGLKVWYDEFSLEIGDSLRRTIDHGLGNAKYGIVVLSPAFFAKQWPQYELDALVNRSMSGEKVILPVWHGVQHQEVSQYSHSLADKVAFSSSSLNIQEMASEFLRLLQKNG